MRTSDESAPGTVGSAPGAIHARAIARLRAFARRRRTPITVIGSLVTAALLAWVLAGRRHEFATALTAAAGWVLAVTTLLQIVALLARTEAWHLTIEAAGGSVARRVLYRASSMQVLGGVINGHLGVAARIAALRQSSPEVSPQVPTLIAAEFPILAIEGTLAALASFTLIDPLGLPWWLPVAIIVAAIAISAGLRHLAVSKGRELWNGLAVLRSVNGGSRVFAFVLVAVLAQVARNWMLLRAVGVDASFWDAIAVLIAVVSLSQLPTGPSVGAASAVLILGRHGVANAAAAGVLLTVTGTVGGLCFAAWAGVDRLLGGRARARRAGEPETQRVPAYGRLRDEVAAATGDGPVRDVLDLGTGSGETAQRVLARHPGARLVGIDASPDSLALARDALPGADLRLARLEDPLPAGPFDLVICALAVHQLDAPGRADLIARTAAVLRPGGRLVLGDVVAPEDPVDGGTPTESGDGRPSRVADLLRCLEQAGLAASPAWLQRDLAVLVATRRPALP
jgi:SAM-dependent methyltransferase